MIDQNPPSKFAKLQEAAKKTKATDQAPVQKRDFKSLYMTGQESQPSPATPTAPTASPQASPSIYTAPKVAPANPVTGIFQDEQNTAPKIDMPGPGASMSDFRPQKPIAGLPQEQPSYKFKGMPFTQKDAMAQIYKAQSPQDLEGLEVSNDPIAMKGLQKRMDSFNQPASEPTKPESDVNPFLSYLNIFSSRIANTPADLGEGWAIASAAIERGLGKIGFPGANKDAKASNVATFKASENWRKFMDEVYPVNQPDRESFLGGVVDGLGQVVPLALTGGSSAMPKVALQATKAGTSITPYINTGKEIVKRFASKEGVIAGSQIAAPSYKQAIEEGATEDEALRFAIENYVVGSVVENLPIQSMFSRIAKLEPKAPILNILKEGAVGGGEEAVTEMWQTTYENWSAQRIYDANREIFEGIGEAGSIGGTVGFILNAATTALIGKRARTSNPKEKEVLDKAITELEQKQEQVEQNNQQFSNNVKALELSSLMGEGVGPKSFGSTKPSNTERRKQAGKVVLAKDKNGKTIEVIGVSKPQEDGSILYSAITPGGKFVKVNENDISDVTDVDLETFDQVLQGKFSNTVDQENEINTQAINQATSAVDQFRSEFVPFAVQTPMGPVVSLAQHDGNDVFVLQDQPNNNVLIQAPGQERKIVPASQLTGTQFLPFDQFVSQFGPVPQEATAPFDPSNPIQAGEEVELEGKTFVVTGVNYETNQVALELQDGDSVDVVDVPLEVFQGLRKPAEITTPAVETPAQAAPVEEKTGAAKLRELFQPQEEAKPATTPETLPVNESAPESPSIPEPTTNPDQGAVELPAAENAPAEPIDQGIDNQVPVGEKPFKIKYGVKDVDLKGNPQKQWMKPAESAQETTDRVASFVEASAYDGREFSAYIDRNGENTEVKLRKDGDKWNWYYPKSKKPFSSFDTAKEAVGFIQSQPFWDNGDLNKDGKTDDYFKKSNLEFIQRQLENGNILQDINEGIISASDTKKIIENAGLKVPENILELVSKENQPTTNDQLQQAEPDQQAGQEDVQAEQNQENSPEEVQGQEWVGGSVLEKRAKSITVPKGKGSWRASFNRSNDSSIMTSILEGISDMNTLSENEANDVFEAAMKLKDLNSSASRVFWNLANNKKTPNSVFDKIIASKELEKTGSDDAIKFVVDKRSKPKTPAKPRKKTPEQIRKQEILDREPATATGYARKWLLTGGKLNSVQSAGNKEKGVGIGKGVRDETGMSGREMRSLFGIIDNKKGLSPEVAAERIHETLFPEVADRISVQDLRNALIDVLLSEDRKQWVDNQDAETKESSMDGYDQWLMSTLTPEEIAEFEAREQEESYWEYISENVDELAKQWDQFEQSEAYQQYIEEVYGQFEESATDGENQSDVGNQGQAEQPEPIPGTDGDGIDAGRDGQKPDRANPGTTPKTQSERAKGTGSDSGKPLANLNPSGNFTQALNAGREALSKEQLLALEANGKFLNGIMGDFPQLTQVHENEIFDLINSGADKKAIAQLVANKVNTIDFDASKPLRLSGKAEASPVTKRGEIEKQIKAIGKKVAELRKKKSLSVLEKAEIAAMTKEVNRLQQEYDKALPKEQAAKPVEQADLFSGPKKADGNTQNKLREVNGYNITNTPSFEDVNIVPFSEFQSSMDPIRANQGRWDKALLQGVEPLRNGWFQVDKDVTSGEVFLYAPSTKEGVVISRKKGGGSAILISDFVSNNPRVEADNQAKKTPNQADQGGNVFANPKPKAADLVNKPTPKEKQELPKSDKSEADKPKPTQTKQEEVAAVAKDKFKDVGEKIGGAKKDTYTKQTTNLELNTLQRLIDEPLSKTIPEPDYKQLVEDGLINEDDAITLKLTRELLGRKPTKPYRIQRWAEQAKVYSEWVEKTLKGEPIVAGKSIAQVVADGKKRINSSWEFQKWAEQIDLYKKLSWITTGTTPGVYQIKGEGDQRFVVKGQYIVGGRGNDRMTFNEAAEWIAITRLKELAKERESGGKLWKFKVYQDRTTKDIYIERANFPGIRVKQGFTDSKEAFNYIREQYADLVESFNQLKDIPEERRAENNSRIGQDHRNGRNIASAEEFMDTFGLRAVEFGNWVNPQERQDSINKAYDALMDMAMILKVPPKALGLNGELGLAFGARGSKGAAAHYESAKKVINLTKESGAGSLAHEWWHGFDNYLSRRRNEPGGFMSERAREFIANNNDPRGLGQDPTRKEIFAAFNAINKVINRKGGQWERSQLRDKYKSKKYYQTPREMTARAFESYIIDRLATQNTVNDYLANIEAEEDYTRQEVYPYPTKEEKEDLFKGFDQLFNEIKVDQADPKKPMYMVVPEDSGNIPVSEDSNISRPKMMIIGEKGASRLDQVEEATVRMDNLAVAMEMEQAGKKPIQIRMATGWERGADGKWRYEIEDGTVKMSFADIQKLKTDQDGIYSESVKLDQVLDNPALFKSYPALKDVNVSLYDRSKIADDGFTEASLKNIRIGKPSTESDYSQGRTGELRTGNSGQVQGNKATEANPFTSFRSILLHEVQHILQGIEGFGRGANSKTLWDSLIDNKVQEFAKKGEYQDADQAGQREIAEDLLTSQYGGPYEAYQAVQGEVESRNVQRRTDLNPTQRRVKTLQSTEDVSREDQIFLEGAGIAISESAPLPKRASDLLKSAPQTTLAKQVNKVKAESDRVTSTWKNGPAIQVYPNGAAIEAAFPAVEFRDMDRVPGLFYDGKVILNASHPFHNNPGGTETIILHESIGHYGLGNVINQLAAAKKQDSDQVFRQLMSTVFDRYKDTELMAYVAKTYWGKDVVNLTELEQIEAGEEYIAHTVQTGVKDKWIDQVVAKIREILRKLGFQLKMADSEFRAILGRASRFVVDGPERMSLSVSNSPAMMISPEGSGIRINDFVPADKKSKIQSRLENSPNFLTNPRYMVDPAGVETKAVENQRRKGFLAGAKAFFKRKPTLKEKKGKASFREDIQDAMLPGRRMLEAKFGKNIPEEQDFYTKENLAADKVVFQIGQMENKFMNPIKKLTTEIQDKHGVTFEQIEDYLIALHDQERRDELITKYPKEAEANKDSPEWPTGMTPEDAAKIKAEYEAIVPQAERDQLNKLVKDLVNFSLDKRKESGLISEKYYTQLKNQYQNYVPLRGFDDHIEYDVTKYSPLKQAKGRKSKAASPLAYLYADAADAIAHGERNKVFQSMLEFAKKNPDNRVFQIKTTFYRKAKKEDGSQTWIEFNEEEARPDTTELEKGTAIRGFNPDIMKDVAMSKVGDLTLPVWVNGQRVTIQFKSGNEQLVKAIKNTSYSKIEGFLKVSQKLNRFLSSAFTEYSPEFGFVNAARDLGMGGFSIIADNGFDMLAKTTKKYPFAWNDLRKFFFSGDNFENIDNPYLKEFMESGGFTGFSQAKEVREVYDELARGTQMTIFNNKVVNFLGDGLSAHNKSIENSLRFAYFQALREDGMTIQKAAAKAKDVTVNFRRRGNMTSNIGALYAFFNASVQGIERFTRPFFQSPEVRRKAQIMAVGLFVSGFMQGILFNLIGGIDEEDDELKYDKIPGYIKSMNLILPAPTDSGFFTVPLGYGLNVPFALGELLSSVILGKTKPSEAVWRMLTISSDSFSPLGGYDFDDENRSMSQKVAQFATPTYARPVLDLAINTNFAGFQIVQQNPWDKGTPNSQSGKPTTSGIAVKAAQLINSATGGDEVVPGLVDINPTAMEYLVRQYGGGPLSFAQKLTKTSELLFEGENPLQGDGSRKVPFASRFYQDADNSSTTTSNYFKIREQVQIAQDRYEKYLKADRADKAEDFYQKNQPLIESSGIMEDYDKALKSIKKEMNAVRDSDPDYYKSLKQEQEAMMKEFNQVYRMIKGDKQIRARDLLGN